ncbi:MAG: mechanosensitive ion channel family protein [Melioribacteraceae bacterium]|nr:mechanosensitive ion channel family protein [Melioribacteraceae bacterium]
MEKQITDILFDPTIGKIVSVIVIALIIISISKLIQRNISKVVKDNSSKYRVRKFINFFGFILIILAASIIYSDKLGGLTVAFGVAGAGIAFALQEIIVSIAGWIAITFGRYYKVGDRILLGGVKGDVIDISVMRTTLMECGEWINGDLYNGRVVRISNGFLFKDPVYNYSGDFPFLWDEIVVPIKHGSDVNEVKAIFAEIADSIVGEYSKNANSAWIELVNKYMVENAQIKPLITLTFNENWINFTIRYVVDYKSRRGTKDQLFSKILEASKNTPDKIKIAYSTLEISQNAAFDLNINKIT